MKNLIFLLLTDLTISVIIFGFVALILKRFDIRSKQKPSNKKLRNYFLIGFFMIFVMSLPFPFSWVVNFSQKPFGQLLLEYPNILLIIPAVASVFLSILFLESSLEKQEKIFKEKAPNEKEREGISSQKFLRIIFYILIILLIILFCLAS